MLEALVYLRKELTILRSLFHAMRNCRAPAKIKFLLLPTATLVWACFTPYRHNSLYIYFHLAGTGVTNGTVS